MLNKRILAPILLLAAIIFGHQTASASITLPALIGDNMVLQRDMKVPIYGRADAGEQIQVSFMGKTFKTTAGTDGKWSVKLNSYKAGGPYEMTVSGNGSAINLKNILIGDVWLGSGQSNMEFGIQTERHGKDAIANATDQQIHFFYVPMVQSLWPLPDVTATGADSPNGKWMVCSPELLGNPKFAWHGFSALAYYFALQIRKVANVPMGMIAGYRGGTPSQAWISEEGLKQSPAFTKYVNARKTLADNFEQNKVTYPTRLTAYRDSMKIWDAEVGTEYNAAVKKWEADVQTAKAKWQPLPQRPKASRPAPRAPQQPGGDNFTPTTCYNGIIAPLVGYGIKGVLWYQGESNADNFADATEYQDVFTRVITDWRRLWQQGDFPFLYIQLTGFRAPSVTPSEGNWAWAREGQQKTLKLKNTGMAVITDVGEANDVHPTNKLDPGNRLALVAVDKVYHSKVVSSGPAYKSMKVEGNKIIVSFDEVHQGLSAGTPTNDGTVTMNTDDLKGFGIAGEGGKFFWAKAVIVGNTIEVSSDKVFNPLAVRYNWVDNTPGNLYNKDGLPAAPFRTDDWVPSK